MPFASKLGTMSSSSAADDAAETDATNESLFLQLNHLMPGISLSSFLCKNECHLFLMTFFKNPHWRLVILFLLYPLAPTTPSKRALEHQPQTNSTIGSIIRCFSVPLLKSSICITIFPSDTNVFHAM